MEIYQLRIFHASHEPLKTSSFPANLFVSQRNILLLRNKASSLDGHTEGRVVRVFRSSLEPLSASKIPANLSTPQKRMHPKIHPFLWRRERDLNPCIHSCITRFRIVRVRPLRHLCKQLLYYTAFPLKKQVFLCVF